MSADQVDPKATYAAYYRDGQAMTQFGIMSGTSVIKILTQSPDPSRLRFIPFP